MRKPFPVFLREQRRLCGKTPQDVSRLFSSATTSAVVGKWESGEITPQAKTVAKIAGYLKIPALDFADKTTWTGSRRTLLKHAAHTKTSAAHTSKKKQPKVRKPRHSIAGRVGTRLYRLRRLHRFSGTLLATKSGISAYIISRIESNKRKASPEEKDTLARAFGYGNWQEALLNDRKSNSRNRVLKPQMEQTLPSVDDSPEVSESVLNIARAIEKEVQRQVKERTTRIKAVLDSLDN